VVAALNREDYIMAPVSGLYEPLLELGDAVETGQPVAQIHSFEQPFQEPFTVVAQTGGILFSRRSFPLTQQGDCISVIVRPFEVD
jgi:predicted deacylase